MVLRVLKVQVLARSFRAFVGNLSCVLMRGVWLVVRLQMVLWACLAIASPATRDAVFQAAREHGIPDMDAGFLASRIDDIEQSKKATVSFDGMSEWRRQRFETAIRQWAETFPQPAGRSETINRGHAWGVMQTIAPLFVVPPRGTEPRDADTIERQVAEIRSIVSTALGPLLRSRFEAVAKSGADAYGSLLKADERDALCAATIDEALAGIALSREDDLNPSPRHPIPESEWPNVRRAAEATVARIDPRAGQPVSENLIDALRKAEAAVDAEERRSLLESLRGEVAWEVNAALHSDDSALSVLSKAFAATVTAAETREYRAYAEVLESMIDTEAIRVGEKDRWALAEANERRWIEERRREFAEVVARSPQAQERKTPPGGSGRRLSPYIVVNGMLVCVLAAASWIRRLTKKG